MKNPRGLLVATAITGLVTAGLATTFEGAASAAIRHAAPSANPSPPYTECPAVGYNTSCSLLIDVENGGTAILDDPGATVASDPTPGTYDGADDTLIGIVNNTSAPLSQISLSSTDEDIFAFDGDGICENPNSTSGLPGLPASDCADVNHVDTTTYGGPNTYFTNISADFMSGIANFIVPLAPGQSTYFSLEEALQPVNFIPPTTLATSLSGGGQSGASITVPPGTSVTDAATLTGTNAASATGTVTYNVYSDSACTNLVSAGAAETVTAGTVPASAPEAFATSGTYYWQAVYSGDANNGASESPCGSEVETVPSGPATLKVCKVAGPGVKVGTEVGFTADGRRFTVPAGPAPGGYCEIVPGKFTEGENVTITELIPNTMSVTAITSAPPGRVVSRNVHKGYVTDTLGSGVTEVTFTDEVVRGTGYAEICNSAASGVTGYYSFIYDGTTINVPVGACSSALKVHAGALTIKEKQKAGSTFSTCKASPSGRLLQCYQSTRTAIVAIVPGNVSTETIVRFVNT
jgi:hypothetical protein